MSSYNNMQSGSSPSRFPTGGPPSTLTVEAALQNPNLPSSRETMASVNAWREHQASMNRSGSSEEEDRLDDNASSDGMGGIKRSHDSQGDSRDEPRRRRLVTTPHQVAVLSDELRRNPFPNAERREELAKELGMEPRRVQVWFQNRRQAERLARGRPPYNMMYAPNPWYPGYPYPPGYPAGAPPPGPYPPMGMTGDPSLDILIPYGPRRPSLLPPSIQGDSSMRGSLPPSHAMSGSLASRSSANQMAAASYRPGDGFDDMGRRDSSTREGRQNDYGPPPPPTTLAEDLAALRGESSLKHERHGSRGEQQLSLHDDPRRSSDSTSTRSHLQPFQSLSSELSLPLPSSLNRASGLPSLSSSLDDPFRLPLPKVSSRHQRGSGAEQSPFGTAPFDPSRTLAPPRSAGDKGSSSHSPGRLPSLSQALEMHPELSPDPTSFRYPPGYEQSLLGNNSAAPPRPGVSLRRRSSLSRMNESNSMGRSQGFGGSTYNSAGSSSGLPPLQPFDFERGFSGESFRSPAPPRPSQDFSHPLMSSQSAQQRLRRMPSDATVHSTMRRSSLRESQAAKDAYQQPPPPGRYGGL